MENGVGTLVYLFIGYICGVLFAPEVISANLTLTNWYNVWTYAWIFGWPIMLIAHFLWPLFTASGPAVVVVQPVAPVAPFTH